MAVELALPRRTAVRRMPVTPTGTLKGLFSQLRTISPAAGRVVSRWVAGVALEAGKTVARAASLAEPALRVQRTSASFAPGVNTTALASTMYAPASTSIDAILVGVLPMPKGLPSWKTDWASARPAGPLSPRSPRGPGSPLGPAGPASPAPPSWPASRLVAGSLPSLTSRASRDPSLTFHDVTASRAIAGDVTELCPSPAAAYELP